MEGKELFKRLKAGIIDMLGNEGVTGLEGDTTESSIFGDVDTFAISINSVGAMLTYCEPVQDRAFVFCEFGTIPEEIEIEAIRKLMELNFLLYKGNSPSFARDPQSGLVVLMAEIPLSEATPENSFAYLQSVAEQALEWRKTFYLHPGAQVAPEFSALA